MGILRSPLLAVLMLALVLRAAIPIGYMPTTAPDGGASQCLLELSALPPLHTAHVFSAIEPASLGEVERLDLDLNILFTPARIQQARAPPVSRLIRT